LVDEIDLHVHPEWQRTIVPRIARTLSKLQFIFTTHSPLVVGTLEKENIWIVRNVRGRPVLSRPEEEVYGLSADQILRSDLFGLASTRNPEFAQQLASLAKDAERGELGAASLYMRKAARGADAIEMRPTRADTSELPEWLKKIARG
jgi:predicted ATP-binding protein involved in virulence